MLLEKRTLDVEMKDESAPVKAEFNKHRYSDSFFEHDYKYISRYEKSQDYITIWTVCSNCADSNYS